MTDLRSKTDRVPRQPELTEETVTKQIMRPHTDSVKQVAPTAQLVYWRFTGDTILFGTGFAEDLASPPT